jgi:hypothetical protein
VSEISYISARVFVEIPTPLPTRGRSLRVDGIASEYGITFVRRLQQTFSPRLIDPKCQVFSSKATLAANFRLPAAAELCRVFGNHIAHGNDIVPTSQSDWSESGWGDANFVVYSSVLGLAPWPPRSNHHRSDSE